MTRLVFTPATLLVSILAGCGQSGPLYLPGDPSEIREAPRPAETAAGAEEEDEAEEDR